MKPPFKCSILKNLKNKIWPTDCIKQRQIIKNYIQNIQNQILISTPPQQLRIIASHTFNIKNRIHAIDHILEKSKNDKLNKLTFKSTPLKVKKFILLNQTKFLNVSKLPIYKIIKIKISNKNKKLLNINISIDEILQYMFLNFIDVLIEDELKSEIFAYRHKRDKRMVIAAIYSKLNKIEYLEQMHISLIKIRKYSNNILYDKILKHYLFPKCYKFLLKR